MANYIHGTYTIRDVLLLTQQYVKNRFKYAKRDVVKHIVIKKVKSYSDTGKNKPSIYYLIESKSWPNYKPYFDPKSGRKYQRKVFHKYDVILQLDKLSIDTKVWKGRLGSGKKWVNNPPQKFIKQIYKETRENWKKKYSKEELKKIITTHKKRATYLDVGDYNARVNGINGDFKFRLAFVWKKYGHLYGREYDIANNTAPTKTNPKQIMFFPKHFINVIEILLNRGILKEGE